MQLLAICIITVCAVLSIAGLLHTVTVNNCLHPFLTILTLKFHIQPVVQFSLMCIWTIMQAVIQLSVLYSRLY